MRGTGTLTGILTDGSDTAGRAAACRRGLAGYGEREQTCTDHLRLVLQYAGWPVPRGLVALSAAGSAGRDSRAPASWAANTSAGREHAIPADL